MDRRFATVLGMSLLFALVVSALFYQVVAGSGKGRKRGRVETRDLVVAARPLPVGLNLKRADLKVVQVPAEQFPKDCFSDIKQVEDRPVISSVLADEPIRDGRLAARGSGAGLAPIIPEGMRAVAVRVNEVVGVAGFVLPGMRVDVLATGHLPGDDASTTKTILQNIQVLSAGQTIEPDGRGQAINAPVVTLLVTLEQAEALTLASEWRVQLVLRNSGDNKIEMTSGQKMAALFGRAEKPVAPSQPRIVRPRVPHVEAAPPPPPPKTTEDIVVIRGTQKTIEQVGIRTP